MHMLPQDRREGLAVSATITEVMRPYAIHDCMFLEIQLFEAYVVQRFSRAEYISQ